MSDPVAEEPADTGPPVVLVHGFGGWSREEMGGKFFYWGGFTDLEGSLNRRGRCKVFTAAVGPFSSVWDRAVELFYQIKGGTVDYGKQHSALHGHARYGRTFPGLYPAWDSQHPVHLVGHSMGGSTARCLVQLLSDNGLSGGEVGLFGASPREDAGQAREECEGGEGGEGGEGFALAMRSHPGWEVSSSWVMSVTCIASPHDGTPMVDILDKWMDGVFNSMCYGAALSSDSEQRVFDFKLDHWGVHPRQPSESFKAYSARVLAAPVFKQKPRDLCHHDLSLRGAAELNSWVCPVDGVLYLSFSCCTTYCNWLTGSNHLPLVATQPLFLLSAALLGSVKLKEEHQLWSEHTEEGKEGDAGSREMEGKGGKEWRRNLDDMTSWRRNDGMVSSCSQHAPTRAFLPSSSQEDDAAGGTGCPGGRGGPGRYVPAGFPVREHRLKVGAKLTKGLLAWRAPASPLRSAPPLATGVWHHLGCLDGFDHLACVGWTHWLDVSALQGKDSTAFWNAPEFYMDLIEMLNFHTSTPAPCSTTVAQAAAAAAEDVERLSRDGRQGDRGV